MKADPFVQLRLLELQALDSSLVQLAHKRRTLPALAEMERLDKLVDALRDGIVRFETEVSDLSREQARFEREIEQVRSRRERDEGRMASGAITVAKQLQDLEHEVATLRRRQSELEDGELEVMERAETAQTSLEQLTAQRAEHLEARTAAETSRDAAVVEIDAELGRTTAERASVAASLPADLLALYEKLRANRRGVGAAELRQRRCTGCHLSIDNAEIEVIRKAASDLVIRCEECSRILVRTGESGL